MKNKTLIIVESPTKAKTISHFLKDNRYIIKSSYGHIRDLPKSKLGIDIENDFQPQYIIPIRARKIINELKKAVTNVNQVVLASDEDREGEAIAWHLSQALKLKNSQRIVFHEITKTAIEKALENPREINLNIVNAQQARRLLDRLVGYKLSPFLWKKIYKGLSAGRVQSVALRLIVEKEREIQNFKKQEYWTLMALLSANTDIEIEARLAKIKGKKLDKLAINSDQDAKKIKKELEKSIYKIIEIESKDVSRYPSPPFTTSTLQQKSNNQLGFSAKKTMILAQQLYEGINLGGKRTGLITYMRTDSVHLSDESLLQAKNYLQKNFPPEYYQGRQYKTKSKGAQEAHEAIRPTDVNFEPDKIKKYLNRDQFRLYQLIWQRFLASQMAPAKFLAVKITIAAGPKQEPNKFELVSNEQFLKFDGYLRIINSEEKLNKKNQSKLAKISNLKKDQLLDLVKVLAEQHFTEPPARYSEATLVKKLEELGIGRPSTYASIISTIQDRKYVIKNQQKKLEPQEIGFLVNDLLIKHFPQIVNYQFTANLEDELDQIAQEKADWIKVLSNFWRPFEKNLEKKYQEVEKINQDEETDQICPLCGGKVVIKTGRFGKFYACQNFPKCRWTKPIIKSTGVKCPKCKKGEIIERRTKKGKIFYGCSRYPKCKFALWDKPTGDICPKCGSLIIQTKSGKIKCSNQECITNKK
ncbi:MAG TPA: type I DNA topoisomerase [Candidatus Portnoybacteria bacterium]|nr:type I DNA topoisomerase [Candidatus Portnoybacteria bacterium]